MRKLSDFYITNGQLIKRVERRLSSVTLIVVEEGVYDVMGDAVFSSLGLNSLLEIMDALKELTSSKVPIKIRRVRGNFWCSDNNLKDLRGAPEEVKGNFHCYYNYLETLEGAPKYVSGDFECWGDRLKDLKGAPKCVGGNFYCYENPKKFTEEEVRKLINVGGKVYVQNGR
jgi:hypothetical protein